MGRGKKHSREFGMNAKGFRCSVAKASLREIPNSSRRARLFIRDLQCFSSDVKVQERLQGTRHEFYLGMPYFDDETVVKTLTLPVGERSLKQKSMELVEHKKGLAQVYRTRLPSQTMKFIFSSLFKPCVSPGSNLTKRLWSA